MDRLLIVLAILGALVLLAIAAGYGLYRFAVVRRPAPPPPNPEKAPNAARRYYAEHFEEQMEWLRRWGWQEIRLDNGRGQQLAGYLFRAKTPTRRICLAVHGHRSQAMREYLYFAPMYLEELGMDLLLVDNAAHGQSTGKHIGFGWFDRLDCLLWVKWIGEKLGRDREILLQGVSMGAATVLMAAGEESLPANVRWVVADCGYTSMRDELRWEMGHGFHLPAFPVYHLGSLWCRLLAGYFFGRANTLAHTKRIKVPTLFIHGAEDKYVPTEMGVALHASCPAPKALWLVEGAAHAESYLVAPKAYCNRVKELLQLEGKSGGAPGPATG